MTGDRDAEYLVFLTSNHGRLLRTARLLAAGDSYWAEDLVQIALSKAYVHWGRITRMDDPVQYTDRLLVNVFIDERRKTWRRRETSTAEMFDPAPAPTIDVAGRLTILAALKELPRRQRAAVVLRYFRDLDIATVARLLDCSEGTVKSQTSRGLEKLRNLIGDDLDAKESVR